MRHDVLEFGLGKTLTFSTPACIFVLVVLFLPGGLAGTVARLSGRSRRRAGQQAGTPGERLEVT